MGALANTLPIGIVLPDFSLDGVLHGVERRFILHDCKGKHGTVVAFICNHCPYVQAILPRLISLHDDLEPIGINIVAINSNDAGQYPEDNFAGMVRAAKEKKFPFPYLYDRTQDIAKSYGAVCTPEFFGLNTKGELQYHGRLDASGKATKDGVKRELFEAMQMIAKTGIFHGVAIPSIGCSIKWKMSDGRYRHPSN